MLSVWLSSAGFGCDGVAVWLLCVLLPVIVAVDVVVVVVESVAVSSVLDDV
jgi:hypothetical protein